jgi:hypothetical protein
MNSAVMLRRLEQTYASADPPVIAIALTTRDMFNPDVNWRYVFSYRRDNRLAVVSPARMDRGCMGLFSADEPRIRARLRKMVGKNVGIMYFGLGPSTDPRQHAVRKHRRTAGARLDERAFLSGSLRGVRVLASPSTRESVALELTGRHRRHRRPAQMPPN